MLALGLLALALPALLLGTGAAALAAARRPPQATPAHAARRVPRKSAKSKPAALKLTFGTGLLALPGPSIQMPPIGLSIEYPVMAEALGSGACPPPALTAELERLGSPPIQLAGASQDLTAPAGALVGQQPSWEQASLYSLPPAFWSQLHCLLQSTMDPLTVGLNLRTGSPAWAEQIIAGARAAAVNGLSFSLGNEPDLYGLPNYAALDTPLPGEELAVTDLFIQLAGSLAAETSPTPLVGPELAIPERWRAQFPRVLKAMHYQTVGVHMYPLTACNTPRAVTVPGMLSHYAAHAPARLAWVVADALAEGVPAIISEANSASCGGVAGVSDSPAAAVWAVRFVLSALQSGFREVRFHLSGNAYDPFLVRAGEVIARPLETALVSLNQWLPVGASVHPVAAGASRHLSVSAIEQPGGQLLLLLDNEGTRTQKILLGTTQTLQAQELTAAHPGLFARTLIPRAGRASLALAPNTILAIAPPTPAP
jgi:hypothetical protein